MIKTSPLTILICFIASVVQADLDVLGLETSQPKIYVPLPKSSGAGYTSPARLPNTPSAIESTIHILIDDFEGNPVLNHLGGFSGAWDKDPNNTDESCIQSIIYDTKNKKDKVLRLQYDVEAAGTAYNGFWTRLNRINLDSLEELRFWVRGDPEDGFTKAFKIELKNSNGTSFLYIQGITSRWQEVVIPLHKFRGLNKNRVDELVIVFEDHLANPKKGTLYFNDLAFVGSRSSYEKEIESSRARLYEELSKTLSLNDSEFLSTMQKKIFQYFLDQSDLSTGLVRDRSTPNAPASIAATGFGLVSYCIAEKNGWLSRVEAYNIILKVLRTLEDHASHEHGYFYHFLDPKTAKRWADSEVSSIDTALLMAGVLFAGQYFQGTEVSILAQRLYNRVQWNWMAKNDKGLLYMQWKPETEFTDSASWNMAAEEMILYLLAMGSPSYSIPADAWLEWSRDEYEINGLKIISEPGRSLFTHLYSHAFIDFRNVRDVFSNYWENSKNAIEADRQFCMTHQNKFKGYGPWGWGLSASDGPNGYKAYGAKEGAHDGTLAPYALIASLPFTPEIVLPCVRQLLMNYGGKIWGIYGPTSAMNPQKEWYSKEYIGIDQGIMILMIENYKSEFVWKYLMQHPAIKTGMRKAFVYCATPNWMSSIYMAPVFCPTA